MEESESKQIQLIEYICLGLVFAIIAMRAVCGIVSRYRTVRRLAEETTSKAEAKDLVAKLQVGETMQINYNKDEKFATPSVEQLIPEDELIAAGNTGAN